MPPADFELLRQLKAAKDAALLGNPLPPSTDPRLTDPDSVAWLSLISDERGLWCLTDPTFRAVQQMTLAVA